MRLLRVGGTGIPVWVGVARTTGRNACATLGRASTGTNACATLRLISSGMNTRVTLQLTLPESGIR